MDGHLHSYYFGSTEAKTLSTRQVGDTLYMQVTENGLTYEVTIHDNGSKQWRLNDKLHREDGPAVEWADGTKAWYKNDQCHREDGPAVEYADGDKFWYKNGQCHREDGPAIERADGDKSWYKNGQYHREDGPAIKYANGDKSWWLNGINYSEAQFNAFFTITLFSGRKQNVHEI